MRWWKCSGNNVGDGGTTLNEVMPLKHIHKNSSNVKFYVMFILWQKKPTFFFTAET